MKNELIWFLLLLAVFFLLFLVIYETNHRNIDCENQPDDIYLKYLQGYVCKANLTPYETYYYLKLTEDTCDIYR